MIGLRMAMPDFSLNDGTYVYCLVANVIDEQALTYEQIMKSEYRDHWQKTMKDEMNSIMSQGTWVLKHRSSRCHTILN